MSNLSNDIYENYLKFKMENYDLTTDELNKLKITSILTNTFNLEQQKLFEEFEYLIKKLNHKYNEQLINFTIDYLKKHP